MQDRRFYVYVVTVDGRAKYIGKGTGNRHRTHLTNSHNPELRTYRSMGCRMRSRIIVQGLTEAQAFSVEREWITKFRHRLANADSGTRSVHERCLWELRDFKNSLMTESEIVAEGEWGGMTVEQRLHHHDWIQSAIYKMKMYHEQQLGICHGP